MGPEFHLGCAQRYNSLELKRETGKQVEGKKELLLGSIVQGLVWV